MTQRLLAALLVAPILLGAEEPVIYDDGTFRCIAERRCVSSPRRAAEARTARRRQLCAFIVTEYHSFVVAIGVTNIRAFCGSYARSELIADAKRSQIDLAPAGGDRVQEGVRKIYAAPPNIVERAREAIRR